jgi:ectoine hydroxylase-related dioxygenase (phytanoyl-CoA dioxygenase family)
MSNFTITPEQLKQFEDDGYFIVERLFDEAEIDLLGKIARADHRLNQQASNRRDGQGDTVKLTIHNELGDDIYAAFVRCRRVVDTMEALLGGEVYHYHHKMILKEPHVGGAWEWHQDYGYWYNNGCLFPLLASCMIAVDRAGRDNGCLEVLERSHHLGRLDHGKVGDQTGADPERVRAALEHLRLAHCELEPGSAIFFHCNLLHCSAPNRSPRPRWALICCYNAARNNPYKESRHPRYSYLEKWPDSRIKEVGRRQWQELASIAEGVNDTNCTKPKNSHGFH